MGRRKTYDANSVKWPTKITGVAVTRNGIYDGLVRFDGSRQCVSLPVQQRRQFRINAFLKASRLFQFDITLLTNIAKLPTIDSTHEHIQSTFRLGDYARVDDQVSLIEKRLVLELKGEAADPGGEQTGHFGL